MDIAKCIGIIRRNLAREVGKLGVPSIAEVKWDVENLVNVLRHCRDCLPSEKSNGKLTTSQGGSKK